MSSREEYAYTLYLQRVPYAEIKNQCGYPSTKAARSAIKQMLIERGLSHLDATHAQQIAILDVLHRHAWMLLEKRPNDVRVVECLTSLAEQRSKLLGLDMPISSAVIRETPVDYLGFVAESIE